MNDYMQTARRATVGVSALGWIAFICLIGSIAFWMALFVDLLAPPRILSAQTIQAGLTVIAFSLVLPLFWSMLLPSSPAGRLLQKQQWATPGYTAVVCAATFLTYHAWRWSYAWWLAQPGPHESGQAVMLAITSLIAAVLLPALAWCVVTPEQWIAQIEQARQVKRLEMAMKMEEAAMRASYARAVALLNAGISTLTIDQRRELGGILGGFARAQQQALYAIGQSWKEMYGVEAITGGTPDKQLIEQYKGVVNVLIDAGDAMEDVADYVTEAPALSAPATPPTIDSREPHVSDSRGRTLTPVAHVDSRPQSSTPRGDESGRVRQSQAVPDSDSRRSREDDEALALYDRIADRLEEIFTAADVTTLMRWQDKRPAQRLISRWLDIGIIRQVRLGRYERAR